MTATGSSSALSSADMACHCCGSECCKLAPIDLGSWCMELGELLQSDVESIGTCINEGLLNTLTELIVQRIKGKSQAARPEWFRLNKSDLYKLFIRSDSLYVKNILAHDGLCTSHCTLHSKGKLSDVTEVISCLEAIASQGHQGDLARQSLQREVAPSEFNCLEGTMPLLDEPDRQLTEAEVAQLQIFLIHIRDSLCSGSDEDYGLVLDWMAYVAQDPDRKIGLTYCTRNATSESHSYHCIGHHIHESATPPSTRAFFRLT